MIRVTRPTCLKSAARSACDVLVSAVGPSISFFGGVMSQKNLTVLYVLFEFIDCHILGAFCPFFSVELRIGDRITVADGVNQNANSSQHGNTLMTTVQVRLQLPTATLWSTAVSTRAACQNVARTAFCSALVSTLTERRVTRSACCVARRIICLM